MSGNSRIISGSVAQSTTKGKALEKALDALNNPTPKKK